MSEIAAEIQVEHLNIDLRVPFKACFHENVLCWKSIKQQSEHFTRNWKMRQEEKFRNFFQSRPLTYLSEDELRKRRWKTPKHTSSQMLISVLHAFASYVDVCVCDFKSFLHSALCLRQQKQWRSREPVCGMTSLG